MKKILLFFLLLSCGWGCQAPSGLKVNVTIYPNVTVKDHWQHTDLFTFKVIQANIDLSHVGDSVAGTHGFSTCYRILTEIKNFEVNTVTNLVTVNPDGTRVYHFNITGLDPKQEYGIDLIPNTEYLSPTTGTDLVVNNVTNGGECKNLSVVDGKAINISIGAVRIN
jgi:hypothetical protein